nr:MAG TPA: hypothetical protein [Caudoviricetes sp.]
MPPPVITLFLDAEKTSEFQGNTYALNQHSMVW